MEELATYIDTVRPCLEAVYFISGVVVAGAALYALKQIPLLKKTLKIQSKRDALRITAEQCNYYFETIVPLQNVFISAVKKYNVKYYEGWSVTVDKESISVSRNDPPDMTGFKDITEEYSVLNNMESFATFFTSGVGDEKVAYDTVGITFLDFCTKLMPWIIKCRESGYYKNLTELFMRWENRRVSGELMAKKKTLEEKLNMTKVSVAIPVGAEDA